MAQDEGERLGKGNLSLPDVVAQSVGYMGPVFSGTFFIPTIVGLSLTGRGAGIASPFAILLTAIGMLALAWIISRYAKRIHAAGALYDYVSEGFGRPIGLFAGWVYYGGALMLTLAIGLAFGGFASLTLLGRPRRRHQLDLAHARVLARRLGDLGARRADLDARAARARSRLGRRHLRLGDLRDPQGRQRRLLAAAVQPRASPSFSGITYGIVYAGLIFVGFESAANLAEETAEPKRNIPRAIFYSVVAAAHLLRRPRVGARCSPSASTSATLLKNFPPLYAATGNPDFGGDTFGEIVQWLVVIDIAAVGLGTATGTTRGIFALARDRHLPEPLAAVHPRYKTPYVAAIVVAIAAIIVALIVHLSDGLAPGHADDPTRPLVPVLPVRGHDRRVPALHRLPADRAHGLQGTARREPRAASLVAGIARRADERRGALRRRPQGAVDLLVRQDLVARADLAR